MFLFKKALKAWAQGRPVWRYLSQHQNGETLTSYTEVEYWGDPIWTQSKDGSWDWDWDVAPDYVYPEED